MDSPDHELIKDDQIDELDFLDEDGSDILSDDDSVDMHLNTFWDSISHLSDRGLEDAFHVWKLEVQNTGQKIASGNFTQWDELLRDLEEQTLRLQIIRDLFLEKHNIDLFSEQ